MSTRKGETQISEDESNFISRAEERNNNSQGRGDEKVFVNGR